MPFPDDLPLKDAVKLLVSPFVLAALIVQNKFHNNDLPKEAVRLTDELIKELKLKELR